MFEVNKKHNLPASPCMLHTNLEQDEDLAIEKGSHLHSHRTSGKFFLGLPPTPVLLLQARPQYPGYVEFCPLCRFWGHSRCFICWSSQKMVAKQISFEQKPENNYCSLKPHISISRPCSVKNGHFSSTTTRTCTTCERELPEYLRLLIRTFFSSRNSFSMYLPENITLKLKARTVLIHQH